MEYFSEVQAQDKADEYDCITHIIQGRDLREAKRKLRDKMVKKKKNMGELYRNVRGREEE